MSSMKLRSLLGSILLGAAPMSAAATSSAAIFRGSWDPDFGPPYDGLGYRGFADFLVPDECLDGTGWFADGSCGDMSLLAATVELYDATLGSNAPTIDTVVFAPPAIVPDPVLGVFIQGNQVVGADTSIFGPQIGSLPPIYSGRLWLEFVSGEMPPPILTLSIVDTPTVDRGAFLWACDNFIDETRVCESPQVRTTNPGVVTFQRIPEPGSLALIFGALAAGWLARRSIGKG